MYKIYNELTLHIPVIDLHCDLLFYLGNHQARTPLDLESRCAISQLRQGNVHVQTLAVFTETNSQSVKNALHQIEIYRNLPLRYPKEFIHSFPPDNQSKFITILLSIENASGLCGEEEPLHVGLQRLHTLITTVARPLYISLTWNSENRFGGGALTSVGLKEDGKHLLEELDQKKIAVDLSHASDALAYEIIEYMDGHNLTIPIIASHSNSRTIKNVPRNLPDELASEIIRRKGLIGLNLFGKFLGSSKDDMIKHIAHWYALGGENSLVFGADFFYGPDLPAANIPLNGGGYFPDFQDASCYQQLLAFIQHELKLSGRLMEKFSYQNALNSFDKQGFFTLRE